MKIVLKRLIGNEWESVPIEDVVGTSMCDFILATKETCILAIYEGEDPVAFISNSREYVESYKTRGLSLHAEDLKILCADEVNPGFIVKELAGSKFVEVILDNNEASG